MLYAYNCETTLQRFILESRRSQEMLAQTLPLPSLQQGARSAQPPRSAPTDNLKVGNEAGSRDGTPKLPVTGNTLLLQQVSFLMSCLPTRMQLCVQPPTPCPRVQGTIGVYIQVCVYAYKCLSSCSAHLLLERPRHSFFCGFASSHTNFPRCNNSLHI